MLIHRYLFILIINSILIGHIDNQHYCNKYNPNKIIPNSFISHSDFYYIMLNDTFSNTDLSCNQFSAYWLNLVIFGNYLNLMNVSFNLDIPGHLYLVIINVLGFDINYSLFNRNRDQLCVQYSYLDFYYNGIKINSDCSFFDESQRNFMYQIYFTNYVKYSFNYCPYYFFVENIRLYFYYFTNSFIKINYLTFLGIIRLNMIL